MLAGCAGPNLEDYQGQAPELVPSEFFRGELSARGVVKDYAGQVIRTFDADGKGCVCMTFTLLGDYRIATERLQHYGPMAVPDQSPGPTVISANCPF